MKNDPIAFRLSGLSAHDRYLAQAQMARAEALADAAMAVAGWLRRGWVAVAERARVYTAERTRQWPHPQA
ncbi:MAG: hypothetical protein ABI585_00380 [Betaproteobacteria bacterium]